MYYGKKKAIIITIVILVVILILTAIGGVVLFMTTDLFKSNETLFLKYLSNQYEQLAANSKNMQLEDIINAQSQIPYETTASLTFDYQDENGQTMEELKKLNVNIISNEDRIKEYQYANFKVNYDNSNLIDLHYAKSGDLYGLKWEEIVLQHYLIVQNKNLREFASKLGIQNTENIPDEIKTIDYLQLIELTEQEKQHIIQTYGNVLLQNIQPEMYTKQNDMFITKNGENYNTTAYRLDLLPEDIKNIEIKLLQALKQDSITLNLISTKAKLIGLTEELANVNTLVAKIEDRINEIIAEQIDNSNGLSVVVYEYKGETIQTDFILKNEMKITINCSTKNNTKVVNMLIYNLSEKQEYSRINIKLEEAKTKNSTEIKLVVNVDNERNIVITGYGVGLASEGNVQSTISVFVTNETGETISLNYNGQTIYGEDRVDVGDEIGGVNLVILNNYPAQDLNNLLTAIVQRIDYVLAQKILIIGLQNTQNTILENSITQ